MSPMARKEDREDREDMEVKGVVVKARVTINTRRVASPEIAIARVVRKHHELQTDVTVI